MKNLDENSDEDDFDFDDDETFDDDYFCNLGYNSEDRSSENNKNRIRPVSFSSRKTTTENFRKTSLGKFNYDQNRTFTINPDKFKRK